MDVSIYRSKYIGFSLGKPARIFVFIHRCPPVPPGENIMAPSLFPGERKKIIPMP
jgi:hypothetical protein